MTILVTGGGGFSWSGANYVDFDSKPGPAETVVGSVCRLPSTAPTISFIKVTAQR